MPTAVEIQDVEQLRQRNGIDDVELRAQVRRLRVGDVVKLTFVSSTARYETLPVRVTSARAGKFTGELLAPASSAELAGLRPGSLVKFTRTHIHSVPGRPRRPGAAS